jgi:hypothetical protein
MRSPIRVNLFAILLGTGVHAIIVIICCLLLSTVHVISFLYIRPFAYYLFTLGVSGSSFFNGWTLVKVLVMFKAQTNWITMVFSSALFFPVFVLAHVFMIDCFEAAEDGALPFPVDRTIISLVLFALISIPMTYLGGEMARYAESDNKEQGSVRRNKVPRDVPNTTWYAKGQF